MKLNYFKAGEGSPLIILHGLFGSASNFRTLASQYARTFTVYALDLRNHGASPHSDDVSFDAMASDIVEFMDDHDLAKAAVMGHSLGGKVAMQLALNHPERPSRLVIGDIAPVAYPHHHDRIFDGMKAVSERQVTSRKEADAIMADYVDTPEVRLFLLTNLSRTADKSLSWRINVAALYDHYEELAGVPTGAPWDGPALFIRGALSDYVNRDSFPAIYELFPKAKIVTLEGAGHWLHAEKPAEYLELTLPFLRGED